jgi:ferredoxin
MTIMSMFNFFSDAPYGVSITDRLDCSGCKACVNEAPDIFFIADDGRAWVKFPLPVDGQDRAQAAADACPAGLIKVDSE